MSDDGETILGSAFANSEDDVDSTSSHRLSRDTKKNKDINVHPEEFVVVRGQTYRVTRTQISTDCCSPMSPSHLRQALTEAHELIKRQQVQIEEQANKIMELERELALGRNGKLGLTDDNGYSSPCDHNSDVIAHTRVTRRLSKACNASSSSDEFGSSIGSSFVSPLAKTGGPPPRPPIVPVHVSANNNNFNTGDTTSSMPINGPNMPRVGSRLARTRDTTPTSISGTVPTHTSPSSSTSSSTSSSMISQSEPSSPAVMMSIDRDINNNNSISSSTSCKKEPPQRLMARLTMAAQERRKAVGGGSGGGGSGTSGSSSSSSSTLLSRNVATKHKSMPNVIAATAASSHSSDVVGGVGGGVGMGLKSLRQQFSTTLSMDEREQSSSSLALSLSLSFASSSSPTSDTFGELQLHTARTVDDEEEEVDVEVMVEEHQQSVSELEAMSPSKMFRWRSENELTIFIFHDNPQLGANVNKEHEHSVGTTIDEDTELQQQRKLQQQCDKEGNCDVGAGVAGVSSNPTRGIAVDKEKDKGRGIEIMLESKGDDGMMYFILGRVVYCGSTGGVEGANRDNSRGSYVVGCRELCGLQINPKHLQKKETSSGIFSLQLSQESSDMRPLTNKEDLEEFLQHCSTRVDVILAPSHSDCWYPYWEGDRKMAPQFRSKGVGYIRLGDDMSRFGTAFLSTDAGQTFVESESVSQHLNGYASSVSSITSASTCTRPSLDSPMEGGGGGGVMDCSGPTVPREGATLKGLLLQLRDEQVKWSNRAQLLQELQSCATSDPALLPEVLSELMGNITKQKNPYVVRAAAVCVAAVGDAVAGHAGCGAAWKALLHETVNLLRHANRSVADGAKESLTALHGRSLSLSSLAPMLEDVISGPRGRVEGSGSAFNTVRVVQWLSEVADRELGAMWMVTDAPDGSGGSGNGGGCIARAFPRVDVSSSLLRCKPLLLNREEATRDATMGLMARYLALDVVQQQQQCTSTEQDMGCSLRTVLEEPLPPDCMDAIGDMVRRLISPGCRQALDTLYVPVPSSTSGTQSATLTSSMSSLDLTVQRRLARLMAETLRLLCTREGIPIPIHVPTDYSSSLGRSGGLGLGRTCPSPSLSLSRVSSRRAASFKDDQGGNGNGNGGPIGAEIANALHPGLSRKPSGLQSSSPSPGATKSGRGRSVGLGVRSAGTGSRRTLSHSESKTSSKGLLGTLRGDLGTLLQCIAAMGVQDGNDNGGVKGEALRVAMSQVMTTSSAFQNNLLPKDDSNNNNVNVNVNVPTTTTSSPTTGTGSSSKWTQDVKTQISRLIETVTTAASTVCLEDTNNNSNIMISLKTEEPQSQSQSQDLVSSPMFTK
eukprot:gene8194-16849_t